MQAVEVFGIAISGFAYSYHSYNPGKYDRRMKTLEDSDPNNPTDFGITSPGFTTLTQNPE